MGNVQARGAVIIEIIPINQTYIMVKCDKGVAKALSEHFAFEVEGARFHPKVKARQWDGRIKLFSSLTNTIYRGLKGEVISFLNQRGLQVRDLTKHPIEPPLTEVQRRGFIEHVMAKTNQKFELRAYQIEAFDYCQTHERATMLLPTGSGKSMVIYWLTQWYGKKSLIIVDSLSLLEQMASDFGDYGLDVEKNIHKICYGTEKDSEKLIQIGTWQSLVKLPKEWFEKFGLVIGDECHQYDAKSLRQIMENLTKACLRYGFTGTLEGSKVNEMILEGLFGPVKKIIGTKDLIDQGHLSRLKIHCRLLKYPEKEKHRRDYQSEVAYLYAHERRNAFIGDLAASLKGNTLLLFQRIDHGKTLYEDLHWSAPGNKPVYYISGETEGEERETIRKIVNEHKDSIMVASIGTCAKGINIPNLNNIIFASPTKSQIRVLQSIGRGLRKTETKTICNIYDIGDDLCKGNWKNYTYRHMSERLRMYIDEDFPYEIENINIPGPEETPRQRRTDARPQGDTTPGR